MLRSAPLVAVLLLVPVVILGAQADRSAPADPVERALNEADRKLEQWDVRGAWGAALRAGHLVRQSVVPHPLTGRAYAAIMRVALRRGDVSRARIALAKAAEHDGLDRGDLQCFADGIALLTFHLGERPHNLWRFLGAKAYYGMSRGAVKCIEAFGPDHLPSADQVGRLALLSFRASTRLARRCHEPEVALMVLASTWRLLDRFAAGVTGVRADNARGALARRIRREADQVTDELRATADRLNIPEGRLGLPRRAGLTFFLGECFRARALTYESAPPAQLTSGSLTYKDLFLPLANNRMGAEVCYRTVLALEPDHVGAAVQLAGQNIRCHGQARAARVMMSVTRALMERSVAWVGEPCVAPAPRYQTAASLMDQLIQNVSTGETSPRLVALAAEIDRALIAPYLEFGPRFHPEDTVASWHRFPDVVENNTGYRLLVSWDLMRAAQYLRRAVRYGRRPGPEQGGLVPKALQNLGHLHYLVGDYPRALDCYRQSAEADAHDAVTMNNLGALLCIFGAITLDPDLVEEGLDYYERAVELAPDYAYARSSLKFVREVALTWVRYLNRGERSPPVVLSFANSFLFAARSISEGSDPKYLQAMQILDRGLTALPDEEEFLGLMAGWESEGVEERIGHEPERTLQTMRELFGQCFEDAVDKYETLLAEHGADHPHLNYLLAEVFRINWRRHGHDEDAARAAALYEKTLRIAKDHAGAALGLADLHQDRLREKEAIRVLEAVVDELLKPWRPWEGEPGVPAAPRVEDVNRLVAAVAKRFPDTKAWRTFRTRTKLRAKNR